MDSEISLVISAETFRSFPADVQEQIIAKLRSVDGSSTPLAGKAESADDAFEDQPMDLSAQQFKKLVDGCATKTKTALKAMVEGPTPHFRVAAVAKAVGCAPSELSGVWSGITKRLRNIMDDPEAYLWRWDDDAKFDSDEVYTDQGGTVSDTTYRSARRVFGL